MYLKKVYISGFKSFAKATQLQFDESINAIVGPNGSGKSNISDAIRFVLGEQRTSQMRSQKMEDIIFSGTDSERARGAAEVRLTLDRGEETDLIISRKLFRTGESVYMINGKKVRLKDIQNIFFDTGLGKNGYSIVSQGGVDEIIGSSPATIRELVEEAVGVAGFKAKRDETERQLSVTRDNIDRIEDILDEIEYQLEPLETRANKARRYLEISQTLRAIDLVSFYYEEVKARKRLKELDEAIGQADFRILDLEKTFEEKDKFFLDLKQKNRETTRARQELESGHKALSKELRELRESRIREETISENEESDLKRERREHSETLKEIKALDDEERRLERRKIELSNGERDKKDEIKLLEEILEKSESDLSLLRSRQREDQVEREKRLLETKKRNEALIGIKTSLFEKEENLKRLTSLEESYKLKKREEENKSRILSECKENLERTEEHIETLKKKIKTTEEKRESSFREREKCRANLSTLESQLNYQKNLEDSKSGYNRAVLKLLETFKDDKKVFGLVGESFTTDKKVSRAIETVLSSRAQNLIVEDERTASRLIDYLKEGRLGRVTFLPIKSLKPRFIKDNLLQKIKAEEGFIAVASEVIETEKNLKSVYQSLLSRTILMKDFNTASRFRRKYPNFTIVTLEGEIFYPGGAIVGGENKKKRQSVLFISNEIRRLEDEIRDEKTRIEKLTGTYNKLESLRESTQDDLTLLENKKESERTEYSKLTEEKKRLADELKSINSALTPLEKLREEIRELKREERKLENLNEKSGSGFTDDENIEALEEKISSIRTKLTKKSITQNSIKERKDALTERILELRERRDKLTLKLEALSGKILEKDKRYKDRKKKVSELREKIDKKSQQEEDYDSKHKEILKRLNELDERLIKVEDEIKLINRENLLESENKIKLEREKESLELKRENRKERIVEVYNTDFKMVEKNIKSLEEERQKLSEREVVSLREELKSIGPVYPEAIEEYAVLNERYDALKNQYDDLIISEENIIETIEKLNENMKKKFSERFVILNEKFSTIFSHLFDGGEAKMDYSDPDDILNSGIELSAQPPGKSLRSLNLLSGGEKAMTAIALLLSFIELNPAPFSILDEIDAALDDSNIRRFTNYLQKLPVDNQFIIITHRKHTLEACERINGITMGKDGISRTCELKLSDYIN